VLEVRLPFADPEFLRELFATSSALRAGTDIHRALIREDLARIRDAPVVRDGHAEPHD
jgi:hypothetical protein